MLSCIPSDYFAHLPMRGILAIMRRRYNAAASILHSTHQVPRERSARVPDATSDDAVIDSNEQQSRRCSIIGQRWRAALVIDQRTTKKAGKSRLL
jgi:hypothetical protein